jgi:hypothetical protein
MVMTNRSGRGKSSRRRKGDTGKAYTGGWEEAGFEEQREQHKKSQCWKCNVSWKCLNKYKEQMCIGFEEKTFPK